MSNMAKEWNILDPLEIVHQALMKESFMYRYAVEQKLASIVCRLQLAYVERQIAKNASEGAKA